MPASPWPRRCSSWWWVDGGDWVGPAERRAVQGAEIEGISEEQARERLRAADKARTAYVRRLYRCDPADASLYHLVIDSTAMPLDTVIELIVAAARAHAAPVPERSQTH